jgi:uncharacterized protein YbaP (TraB family)
VTRTAALRAAYLVALGTLALAAGQSAAYAADRETSPYSRGRLFRVAKAGVPDSFVFGTIHVADDRVSVLPPAAASALARAKFLAMEIAPVAVADDRYVDLEQQEDGGTLAPLIGPEAYDRVRIELTAHGTPEAIVARLKPWAAMMKLSWGPPRGDARTLDENVLAAALAARVRVFSLESIDEQVAAFDTVPLESQIALLRHAIDHRDGVAALAEPTVAAWLHGDLVALARIPARFAQQSPGMAPHYAALTAQLIDGRTALMHHRLFLPLRAGGVFVAVGASHLSGREGLLARIARDGYRVTRVW